MLLLMMNPNDMQLKNLFVYICYYEHVLNILLINSWIIYNGKLGIKSETLKYNTLVKSSSDKII